MTRGKPAQTKSTAPRSRKSKIKSPAALRRLLARRQGAGGERAVFTNGVFDLLHRGHVSYLEQARNLGDLLVVALNSDDSVRRIKGPERPLNPLEDRLHVMAALECVDYVTWFTDNTPEALVRLLQPRIYVKGGDWKVADLPETPIVRAYGGTVKTLRFVEGRSTTGIIAKAREGRARRAK